MPRENLTPAALEAIFAQSTSEVVLAILTIEEASLPEPIRVVNDTLPVTRLGDVYQPLRFGITMPHEEDGTLRAVELVIDNISRDIAVAIELAIEQPKATLVYALRSNPSQDPPDAGPFALYFQQASYTALTASASLRFTNQLHQRYPRHGFTPAHTPDLFD